MVELQKRKAETVAATDTEYGYVLGAGKGEREDSFSAPRLNDTCNI